MDISVIASTKLEYTASKNDFDMFSGKCAGVCYMPNDFSSLLEEDISKTERRVKQTKESGHHSVYDHNSISLYLHDVPKIVAMILNNEKMYTTSEKSARYTKMVLSDDEQVIYDKWLNVFKKLIADKYQVLYPNFFTTSKIEKLAQENARYTISVFTPTSFVYTTTYRQLNILVSFIQNEIEHLGSGLFDTKLKDEYSKLLQELKKLPYMDTDLQKNEKDRAFSLFRKNDYKIKPYFSDVYITTYLGSLAELAQAQRHRTLSYNMSFPNKTQFYIPPILQSKELIEEWLQDCNTLKDNFPQGMMVEIVESGTLDDFILKMKERKCTFAQLEINHQTNKTLYKYAFELDKAKHPRSNELNTYFKGARCTFTNYKCCSPCAFLEGVYETRLI